MSHWDTCCPYKVAQIISLGSLVHSQRVFKVQRGFSVASSKLHCMCSRHTSTALHWKRVHVPQGDPRMSLHMWCVLVLFLCSGSKEMVVDKTRPARGHSYKMEQGQHIIQNIKRHSDGTFTSDLTHYLDKIKAKDFVEWLASTKREGCHKDLLQIPAEV